MSTQIRLLKFITAGGITVVVEFFCYATLLAIELSPVLANAISYTVALSLSFFMNYTWVFRSNARVKMTFTKYFLLAITNLFIGSVIIKVMIYDIHIDELIAKIIVMGMIALWNYVIYSKILFIECKKKVEPHGSQ